MGRRSRLEMVGFSPIPLSPSFPPHSRPPSPASTEITTPYILAGDFNIQPGVPAYTLATTGALETEGLTGEEKEAKVGVLVGG